MDQTIAHTAQLQGTYYRMGCGTVNRKTISGFLTCTDKTRARFLCKRVKDVPATPETVQMPEPPVTWSHGIRMITCSGGHLTHVFLARDVQSSCHARDASASSFCVARGDDTAGVCRTALTSLPPSFPCGNGRGEVPYTLVCDHRPDCNDGSDESFCVFPPCDAGAQFTCENNQVRTFLNIAVAGRLPGLDFLFVLPGAKVNL